MSTRYARPVETHTEQKPLPMMSPAQTARPPRRAVAPSEQARREAWGREAGAKVAAAYKQMGEAK